MNDPEVSTPLDHADLERSCLGDVSFEKELLAEFLDSSGGMLAALSGAVAASDPTQVHLAAHSLKGCCWTIGARAMGAECEKLEFEARAGGLQGADGMVARIHELAAQLDAYVRRHWGL